MSRARSSQRAPLSTCMIAMATTPNSRRPSDQPPRSVVSPAFLAVASVREWRSAGRSWFERPPLAPIVVAFTRSACSWCFFSSRVRLLEQFGRHAYGELRRPAITVRSDRRARSCCRVITIARRSCQSSRPLQKLGLRMNRLPRACYRFGRSRPWGWRRRAKGGFPSLLLDGCATGASMAAGSAARGRALSSAGERFHLVSGTNGASPAGRGAPRTAVARTRRVGRCGWRGAGSADPWVEGFTGVCPFGGIRAGAAWR